MLVQAEKPPPSTWHSKLVPPSGELNAIVALSDPSTALGPLSITVSGATVSTVQVTLAGLASTFPAASIARTSNVCEPSLNPVSVIVLVQAEKPPPSTWHSNVTPFSGELNAIVALSDPSTAFGPLSITVSGATVSTAQVTLAGLASTFPAASIARTSNVCEPSLNPVSVIVLVQAEKPPPSTWHSNVTPPSGELNAIVALSDPSTALGPLLITVSGATVSTVQVTLAGVRSAPAVASTARTSKV